jgi:apolipoprotein N-acyltransferase
MGGTGPEATREATLRHVGTAIAGGLVLAAAFPPYGAPVLLPAGCALIVASVVRLRPRHALYAGFLAGMACYLATLHWLANLFGPAMVPLCAILAAFIGVFGMLTSWLHRRLPGLPLWVLAPVVWVAIEWYRSEPFVLRFGWIAPSYGVISTPAFQAMAPVAGSYGITLAIMLVACGMLCLWPRRKAAASLLGIVWLAAFALPGSPPAPQRPLRVRLVQANCEDTPEMVARSRIGAGSRADVTVWPEYSFLGDPVRQTSAWRTLQGVARENGTWLIVGGKDEFDAKDRDRFRNTAYVLSPDGRLVGRHVKVHTVHFVNDGVAATRARAIPTAMGRMGVGICFDMDYPDVARRLVEDGTEVFLVPNMDPLEWGPVQREQHRALFAMRAAECGRWLARADVAGGTSVYAPTGREVARVDTTEPARLDVEVGRLRHATAYVRYGWMLPRLCVGATLAFIVAGLLALLRRQARSA